jgi:predicted HAD superfamily Cof-like phosphohydrolase
MGLGLTIDLREVRKIRELENMYSFQDLLARKTKSDIHKTYQKFDPDDAVARLRANLIEEEAAELVDALKNGSLSDVLKETADVLVVVLGTMATFGVDPQLLRDVFDCVDANNRGKVLGGTLRADGKLVKPVGYPKVDLTEFVERYNLEFAA